MSFMRCDPGIRTQPITTPWAMALGPVNRYVHSAYQVCDLDAMALRRRIPLRAWLFPFIGGIGRHIQGSQLFDYWRDPDGFLVEHFTDGDMFDDTLEPGLGTVRGRRACPSGARQSVRTFLGINPKALTTRSAFTDQCSA